MNEWVSLPIASLEYRKEPRKTMRGIFTTSLLVLVTLNLEACDGSVTGCIENSAPCITPDNLPPELANEEGLVAYTVVTAESSRVYVAPLNHPTSRRAVDSAQEHRYLGFPQFDSKRERLLVGIGWGNLLVNINDPGLSAQPIPIQSGGSLRSINSPAIWYSFGSSDGLFVDIFEGMSYTPEISYVDFISGEFSQVEENAVPLTAIAEDTLLVRAMAPGGGGDFDVYLYSVDDGVFHPLAHPVIGLGADRNGLVRSVDWDPESRLLLMSIAAYPEGGFSNGHIIITSLDGSFLKEIGSETQNYVVPRWIKEGYFFFVSSSSGGLTDTIMIGSHQSDDLFTYLHPDDIPGVVVLEYADY